MRVYSVNAGIFKLDGGAMFGVVPKVIWRNIFSSDKNNMIDLSMRCMLIEDGNRLILVDTGMGDKQSDKFFGHYSFFHGNSVLDESLKSLGFDKDDITDVILTHLHFDHCGGVIKWNRDKTFLEPAFRNAKIWSNARHWEWATNPNSREKASFLKENISPIKDSGQLNFFPDTSDIFVEKTPIDNVSLWVVNGHTESQILPQINYKGKTIVFCGDLIPTVGHIGIPYVMSYDTRPLLSMEEKKIFLDKAVENDYVLFLQHDAVNELCTLQRGEKGVEKKGTFAFEELF
ncbi:MBL fold metallo-hydrolase [Ichthyobacterium seriolicida]|uniref:Beta-lactamase n=1 Tax=Ichthyobacterium seriolicida TaxID=242600 RepID=A0A1J1E1P3_9FLAO|nr:MBL fold metallo-hydrolase [Ichthyobacterium seriolicida]BAV94869.1 beta-lactamase [Ichthyobacterium seriolicida]